MSGNLRVDDGRARKGVRSAVLEVPGLAPRTLTFERLDGPLDPAAGADPFVLGSLLVWMQAGVDVHVHGAVTRRLLAGLEEWQGAWVRWRPGWRKIAITADEIVPGRPDGGPAISTFSGGVDSAYTVDRHARGGAGWDRVDLRAAVMIHGLDIPYHEDATFAAARSRGERLLEGTGVELRAVRTDLRALDLPWLDVFGLAVISVLTLFATEASVGLVASSQPYGELLLPLGSSPMFDHLTSTGGMDIRHDGAPASRTEKIARLAEWPAAAAHVRVCWEGERLDRNCGRCEKCIRTLLAFRSAGVQSPASFDRVPCEAELRVLEVPGEPQLVELESVLAHALSRGIDDEWVAALAEGIEHAGRALGRDPASVPDSPAPAPDLPPTPPEPLVGETELAELRRRSDMLDCILAGRWWRLRGHLLPLRRLLLAVSRRSP